MKKLICFVLMFIVVGCDGEQPKEIVQTENTIIETSQPEDVKESTDNSRKSGISIGPKMEIRPSINLSTGELELMPSLHMGPRIDF